MLEIGKIIVHKKHGICTIEERIQMMGQDYYKLVPNFDETMSIFVPINKEQELLREVLTKEEAKKLVLYMREINDNIIEDTKERRDTFQKKFATGELKDLAYVCRKLFLLKQEKERNNEKFCLTDSNMFEKANKMLLDELSLSFNIDRSLIFDYISKMIYE